MCVLSPSLARALDRPPRARSTRTASDLLDATRSDLAESRDPSARAPTARPRPSLSDDEDEDE